VNAIAYFYNFTCRANALNIPYFYFEAFDSLNKANEKSSSVETNFGLATFDRTLKPGIDKSRVTSCPIETKNSTSSSSSSSSSSNSTSNANSVTSNAIIHHQMSIISHILFMLSCVISFS